MLPYWFLFTTFAIGAVSHQTRTGGRGERYALSLGAILLIVLIGLRYEVGIDWLNYLRIYHDIQWISLGSVLNNYGDPGFYLLMWLIQRTGLEIWALNVICAVIFTKGLMSFAQRQPNPWLAVAVAVPYLVIVVAMSGVRQATAIGFVFMSLIAYSDKAPARFIFWLICASAFHASAILVLPLAGLSFTKNRLQAGLLMIVMMLLSYYVLGSTFEIYADDYITQSVESSGTIYRIFMSCLPALIFLARPSAFKLKEHDRKLWRNFSIIAILSFFVFLVMKSSTALDRILLYTFPLQIFVLSAVPTHLVENSKQKLLLTLAILSYLALILIVFLNFAVNRQGYIQYKIYPFLN